MPQKSPTGQQYRTPRWLLITVVVLVIMLLASILVSAVLLQDGVGETPEYTQAQLMEQTLGVAHDELIMLIISLVVVVQITASYKFLKWVPYRPLLVSSFGALALSAVCTVIESFFFQEVVNIIEHLAFLTSSILLIIWCAFVFGSKKREAV